MSLKTSEKTLQILEAIATQPGKNVSAVAFEVGESSRVTLNHIILLEQRKYVERVMIAGEERIFPSTMAAKLWYSFLLELERKHSQLGKELESITRNVTFRPPARDMGPSYPNLKAGSE